LAVCSNEFILGRPILSHPLFGRLTHWTSTRLTYTVWSALHERVYRTKISDVDELKRCIISEWTALSHRRLLTALLKSGVSVYALAFVLEADILSTGLNKDCVM